MKKKNILGQSAIEFVISFIVVAALFALVFAFISANYEEAAQDQNDEQVRAVARDYYDEIKLASRAGDGYEREFSTTGFGGKEFAVSDLDGTAIVVTDESGNEYVQFLTESEYFEGTFCRGSNQIVKSADYGLNVCCGTCDFTFGAFECSTKELEKQDQYWRYCGEREFATEDQFVRALCPVETTQAIMEITQVSDGSQIWTDTVTSYSTLKTDDQAWFESGAVFDLAEEKYNFNVECVGPFTSPSKSQIIDLSDVESIGCDVVACEHQVQIDWSPKVYECQSSCGGGEVCSAGACITP